MFPAVIVRNSHPETTVRWGEEWLFPGGTDRYDNTKGRIPYLSEKFAGELVFHLFGASQWGWVPLE